LRDASVRNTDTTVEGFAQPMRVAGMAWGPAHGLQWGEKARTVDFYDVKADVQRLLAPRRVQCVPASTRPCTPGAAHACWWTARTLA